MSLRVKRSNPNTLRLLPYGRNDGYLNGHHITLSQHSLCGVLISRLGQEFGQMILN
ncbi:MAG: hypothetical protein AAFS12_01520 [Cyanobacteria bacterium J06632_19]